MKYFMVLVFVYTANAANYIPLIDLVNNATVALLLTLHKYLKGEALVKEIAIQGRIISGSPAAVGQFPWQASIIFTSDGVNFFFCGGSLISNQWILSAGHCASGARSFNITLGGIRYTGTEAGRIQLSSNTAIVHPNYNPNTLNNDISLIKLPNPVQFTSNIQPIRLPPRGSQVGVNQTLTVSGWGKTSDSSTTTSPTLNYVALRSISNAECATYYGSGIISSTLCCRGNPIQSTCNGDSGGPLVSYASNGVATHVGVVSFVSSTGCSTGYPSGYVRTESFLDWIAANSGVTS